MKKLGLFESDEIESIIAENNDEINVVSEEASSAGLAWALAALTPGAAAGFCWR